MKNGKLIIGIFLSLVTFSFASAQVLETEEGRHRQKRVDRENQRFGKLSEALELTAEQKKEVYELMKASKKEAKDLKSQFNKSQDVSEEERTVIKNEQREIRSELDAEIMTVLDEVQRTKYTDIIQDRNERSQKRGEQRELIRAYTEDHIKPVLQGQRMKLEDLITAQDKLKLEELRTNIPPLALQNKRRRGKHQGQSRLSKEDKESLRALIEAYRGDIDTLHDEIADQQKEWKEYKDSVNREMRGRDSSKKLKREKRQDKSSQKAQHKYAAFLLMEIG